MIIQVPLIIKNCQVSTEITKFLVMAKNETCAVLHIMEYHLG